MEGLGGAYETKMAARDLTDFAGTVLLIHRFFKPSLSSLFTEHSGFFLARLKKVKVTMGMKRQRKI